jgi:hypothetical protein
VRRCNRRRRSMCPIFFKVSLLRTWPQPREAAEQPAFRSTGSLKCSSRGAKGPGEQSVLAEDLAAVIELKGVSRGRAYS